MTDAVSFPSLPLLDTHDKCDGIGFSTPPYNAIAMLCVTFLGEQLVLASKKGQRYRYSTCPAKEAATNGFQLDRGCKPMHGVYISSEAALR